MFNLEWPTYQEGINKVPLLARAWGRATAVAKKCLVNKTTTLQQHQTAKWIVFIQENVCV
ncbi:hypothetical protein AH444_20865 [Salmonella enterica subsp. enterica]|nr:hypothetical protein [Salmonella enterica]EAC0181372.1 hypothetical protein [Salmonella enterica subsp. enterica serovar Javiana]EAN8771201.1 hypothetical protein [Salmonella enterica]EAP3394226.1 hypothetical protein [Salmonella enterica]EAR6729350.1 hypothetical protein [Salmonella enterica]